MTQHLGTTWYVALCGEHATVTGLIEEVTCPKCLAAFDRALELGFKGMRGVWYYTRIVRGTKRFVARWTKAAVKAQFRAEAKPGRFFRPSSMRMWLEANGRTLADLHRGET